MALATQHDAVLAAGAAVGVMLGVGSGMTALVLSAVVSNRWFERRRGLVVGMLTASSATGQLVFLPVGAWMIEHLGWRMAVVPVLISCAVMAVAALLPDARPAPATWACCPSAPIPPPRRRRRRAGWRWAAPFAVLAVALAQPHLLDAGRHLLHLRPQHQRPDPDATSFRCAAMPAWARCRPPRCWP